MLRKATCVCALAIGLCTGTALADMFTFTIDNVGVQPLTPVFVVSHDGTFDIFDSGAAATPEFVAIAEGGDTGPMELLAMGAGGVLDYDVGDFIIPGESSVVTIMADPAHPYLSFASMLPVTNDAFIGLALDDDALDLYRLGPPQYYDFTLSYLDVWDAGSELNTELAEDVPGLGGAGSPDEGGGVTRPHPGILGVGDVGPEFDFFGHDVAHIVVIPEPGMQSLLLVAGVLLLRRR